MDTYGDHGSVVGCSGLWFRCHTCLWRYKHPVSIACPGVERLLRLLDSPPATSVLFRLRHHLDVTDKADTSERLASETICTQLLQILKLAELAGSVSRAQQRKIGLVDTMPVVGYLDKLETAVFECELDRSRTGVKRVLDELLDSV